MLDVPQRDRFQVITERSPGYVRLNPNYQLVLSVRTVETYVYRAMKKRGVSNRHEL